MALEPGAVLQDRYRLDEHLRVGGQGTLWRGHDLRLKRDVAIKFMLDPAPDSVTFRRFEREAQIAAGLEHPGITTVYDFGSHENQFFIVMQLLRGRDLRGILKEQPGGLPVAEAVEFAIQTLEALAVAHERGVVHRDLKPANLFVIAGDKLKICDFGIAKTADATRITRPNEIIGTLAYMSPEQCSGKDVGPASDLYSVGCVLYETLTGQPPFPPDHQAPLALMGQHLQAPPKPPQGKHVIPEQLRDFVLRLLAKSPEERGTTAADLAAELRKIDLMVGTLASSVSDPSRAAYEEGRQFGRSAAYSASDTWWDAVLAGRPSMPPDLERQMMQGSALPIDLLLDNDVWDAQRRGFWSAIDAAHDWRSSLDTRQQDHPSPGSHLLPRTAVGAPTFTPAAGYQPASLAEATEAAHEEGMEFASTVARDAPALWIEAVLARKPRMPSDLEARLLQGSSLPIDYLLHDEVRYALRRGFWDALERSRT